MRDSHNAPEVLIDHLNLLDKARKGDKDALDKLKEEYEEFFKDKDSEDEGLKELEEYLDDEFGDEFHTSEKEADELDGGRGRKFYPKDPYDPDTSEDEAVKPSDPSDSSDPKPSDPKPSDPSDPYDSSDPKPYDFKSYGPEDSSRVFIL